MFRTTMIGGALLVLAACATATPYAPASSSGGYGFSEQRIERDRFRITFRGNSSTSREIVENSLLYRAAELTVQQGFDHFIVEERDTEARTTFSTTTSPAFYGRYGFGHPFYRPYYAFPYYAYGWGWGVPYDSYTREITRYSAIAFVTMHEGAKPGDNPRAFDAREVLANLGPVVLGDELAS